MSEHDAAAELAEDRATRDAARAMMLTRYGALREELSPDQIKERVSDWLIGDARRAASEVKAVVRENPAVVAGTVAMVAGWLLRRPLGTLGSMAWRTIRSAGAEPRSARRRLRDWISKEIPR